MSMEVKGGCSYCKTGYAGQWKAGWEKEAEWEKAKEAEKQTGGERVKETGKEMGKGQDAVKERGKMPVPQDEYINSEKSGIKPSGLYRLGQDEKGKRKIIFENPEKSPEKCTVNTDQVDREIRNLKEKKQQLEQQIRAASGEGQKVRELEKKLAQVEQELAQKDNDAYRRQHASVSG